MNNGISGSKNTVERLVLASLGFWILLTTTFFLSRLYPHYVFLIDPTLQATFHPEEPIRLAANSLASLWGGLGFALMLLTHRGIRRTQGVMIVGGFVALAMWGNFLREMGQVGDYNDYIRAAKNLLAGEHFHGRYLYPPFLATVLAWMLQFGERFTVTVFWCVNLLSVGIFWFQLANVLSRYGFSKFFAFIVLLFFFAINTPILRTLIYLQVNLLVANFVLLCLLLYPRFPIFSAAALALAVNLKFSPLILTLPFILRLDWRWCIGFATSCLAIGALTVYPYGWSPFHDFLHNIEHIYSANGLAFRENSVDSFVFASWRFLGLLGNAALSIKTTKAIVVLVIMISIVMSVKRKSFTTGTNLPSIVYDSFPGLIMTMLLVSPLLWEHHPVFVALPFLLIIKRLSTTSEWFLYVFAYFFVYQVPTFDYYPWSYVRLLGALMLFFLYAKTCRRQRDGEVFARVNNCPWISTKGDPHQGRSVDSPG